MRAGKIAADQENKMRESKNKFDKDFARETEKIDSSNVPFYERLQIQTGEMDKK